MVTIAFIYTIVLVIAELKRVKALKWNATTYSLFYMAYAAFGLACVHLVYTLNWGDADPKEYVSCWLSVVAEDFAACKTNTLSPVLVTVVHVANSPIRILYHSFEYHCRLRNWSDVARPVR